MPSHWIPNARTGPQPDMMWRTNAVEIQQLTHRQHWTFMINKPEGSTGHNGQKPKQMLSISYFCHFTASASIKGIYSILCFCIQTALMSQIRFQCDAGCAEYLLADKNKSIAHRWQNSSKHPRVSAAALTFVVDASVSVFVSRQQCLHFLFRHFLTLKFDMDLHLRPRCKTE